MDGLRSPRAYHKADYVPLAVVAELDGDIILSRVMPELDGLLAYAVAREHHLAPVDALFNAPPGIEVPLARSACGRYHLATSGLRAGPGKVWWFAVGDVEEVRALLRWVTRLGRKRSQGAAKVERWRVWECEAWGTGFPVVAPGGLALRPLPLDHPLLVEPRAGYGVLTYPYHEAPREEWLALPVDCLPG